MNLTRDSIGRLAEAREIYTGPFANQAVQNEVDEQLGDEVIF